MNKENAFTGLEAAIVLIAFIVVGTVFSYVVLNVPPVKEQFPQPEAANVCASGCTYDCGYKQIWINGVAPGSFGEDITIYDKNFVKYRCEFNVCLNVPAFNCYDVFVFTDRSGETNIAHLELVTDVSSMSDQCKEAMDLRMRNAMAQLPTP